MSLIEIWPKNLLVATPKMLSGIAEVYSPWFFFPSDRDKEEGPAVISLCWSSGMLPLSQKAVVRGRFKGRPKMGSCGKWRS